jgi:serine protease AprX
MHRRAMFGALVSFTMLIALGAQHLLAQVPPAAPDPLIRLKQATFDPLTGEPAMPQSLRASATSGQGMYLVQFSGPVQEDWKAAAERSGAKLYGYIPDHAFIARVKDAAALAQLRALPFVRWVGSYHPAYRLASDLPDARAAGAATVTIEALPDADLDALAAQIAGWGGAVVGRSSNQFGGYLRATVPAGQIGQIASQDGVVWIDQYIQPELLNDVGGGQIMRANEVRQSLGLFGANQIVAVADTGLDVGDPATLHPDVKGRVVKAYCLGRPSPPAPTCDWADHNAHGTHVAGSVLGNGSASGSNPGAHQYSSSFAGVAPEARLVFQSIEAANGSLSGIPDNTGDLMRQAYQDGARIHTNSWGGPTGGTGQNPQYGGYVSSSQFVDQAAWERKDMLILFAAANSGTDANGDGVVDPDSTAQPGTAKNIITVGASENLRATGGYNPGGACSSWGDCWPDKYGASPLAGDTPSDDKNGMAAFSSRGPTDDGRIKPELVAPGTNILSARSRHPDAGTGWGEFDANSNYAFQGGTSMATPLAAGAAAVVREWLTRIKGVANPSAALMKSVMINGAADMGVGQYGSGATQEIPTRRPNNVSGWGRVDLKDALDPAAPRKIWFTDNTTGLSTGQTATYQVTVSASQAQAASIAGPVSGNSDQAQPFVGASAVVQQAGTQLVQNGGFENATFAPWVTFGNSLSVPTLDTTVKHSGAKSAHLGGVDDSADEIQQTLNIAAAASDVTIDFWYQTTSDETIPGVDVFCYGLYDTQSITSYLERCENLVAPGNQSWTHEVYSLSASERADVAGKSVRLIFYVTTDFVSDPSAAWVDDATLTVTAPGGGATPTATAKPTATVPPTPGAGPLRVTLAWTDYPGQPAAAKALVNDLDLEIIAPNGTRYVGNQGLYTSGQCLRDGKYDACNNVEGLILPQAAPGTYTIVVRGAQVPQGGRQPFAITASGNQIQQSGSNLTRRAFLPLVRRPAQLLSSASDVTPVATPLVAPKREAIPSSDDRVTRLTRP